MAESGCPPSTMHLFRSAVMSGFFMHSRRSVITIRHSHLKHVICQQQSSTNNCERRCIWYTHFIVAQEDEDAF